jgi:hypothetical protein
VRAPQSHRTGRPSTGLPQSDTLHALLAHHRWSPPTKCRPPAWIEHLFECRRGDFNPEYTRALERRTGRRLVCRSDDLKSLLRNRDTSPISPTRLTADEIKTLVRQLKGIVEILNNADPEDRKAVYKELNLAVVYHEDGRMQVTAGPDACTDECVGGATLTQSTRATWSAELTAA